MATNVSIDGGNNCEVQSSAGTKAPTNDRKKVLITAAAGGAAGTFTLGSETTAITVAAGTILDLGAFQGTITTVGTARAIIIS
tara:strand:+ start:7731 stop:7979 length:249 start_codon:yes stop_codon:yes gene_type:complete